MSESYSQTEETKEMMGMYNKTKTWLFATPVRAGVTSALGFIAVVAAYVGTIFLLSYLVGGVATSLILLGLAAFFVGYMVAKTKAEDRAAARELERFEERVAATRKALDEARQRAATVEERLRKYNVT